MTRSIQIPRSQAENLRRPPFEWPASGAYVGKIREVRETVVDTVDKDGNRWGGFAADQAVKITVIIGDNRPVTDGAPDVGNHTWAEFITIEDGDLSVLDQPSTLEDSRAWQLLSGQRTLANMAIALGAVGGSNAHVELTEEFVQALRDGSFNGYPIGFVLTDNTYVNRKGEKVSKAVVERFFSPA